MTESQHEAVIHTRRSTHQIGSEPDFAAICTNDRCWTKTYCHNCPDKNGGFWKDVSVREERG
ncbi:hypothetical protein, partial [Roseibium sp.]